MTDLDIALGPRQVPVDVGVLARLKDTTPDDTEAILEVAGMLSRIMYGQDYARCGSLTRKALKGAGRQLLQNARGDLDGVLKLEGALIEPPNVFLASTLKLCQSAYGVAPKLADLFEKRKQKAEADAAIWEAHPEYGEDSPTERPMIDIPKRVDPMSILPEWRGVCDNLFYGTPDRELWLQAPCVRRGTELHVIVWRPEMVAQHQPTFDRYARTPWGVVVKLCANEPKLAEALGL